MGEDFTGYWSARLRFLDVHYHASPDLFARRRGAISTGGLYRDLGGGVVLKNHLGSCVTSAEAARELDLPVLGSLALNHCAGGPHWRVVLQALAQVQAPHSGRLLVHLPTVVPTKHVSRLARTAANDYAARVGTVPTGICSEDGSLAPAVLEIMRMAVDHPIVLSTGHADRDGVLRLIDAAARLGLPRLMLNQPASPMTGMTVSDLMELAREPWLYVEQTALTYILGYQSWDDFREVIRTVPNLIYSSDLGQTSQMDVPEWLDKSREWHIAAELDAGRIERICLANPLAMLAP